MNDFTYTLWLVRDQAFHVGTAWFCALLGSGAISPDLISLVQECQAIVGSRAIAGCRLAHQQIGGIMQDVFNICRDANNNCIPELRQSF